MQDVLAFHQLTSAGDRDINQDYMAHKVCAEYALFVVADGLGGHRAGERASQFFCRALLNLAEQYQPEVQREAGQAIHAWIVAAVDGMREMFAGDHEMAANAHTTCAILYLDERRAIVAHCGDSRVYRLSPTRVLWRTKDHSATQGLLDEGRIAEWEMGEHPEQNQLTRSINALTLPRVDICLSEPARLGETFLLCSDGFWGEVKEHELLQLAQPGSGKDELRKIAQLAVLRGQGSSDNCTVQWIRRVR